LTQVNPLLTQSARAGSERSRNASAAAAGFSAADLLRDSGETLRVAGPNGSGKTSLLRILCGLLTPSAGEVLWNGARIQSLKEDYARHVLYLGHAPAVKDELTGAENLRVACVLAGLSPSPSRRATRWRASACRATSRCASSRRVSAGARRSRASRELAGAGLAARRAVHRARRRGGRAHAHAAGEHAQRGGSVVYSTHQDAGLRDSRVIEL
jgi:heme exporter protein A